MSTTNELLSSVTPDRYPSSGRSFQGHEIQAATDRPRACHYFLIVLLVLLFTAAPSLRAQSVSAWKKVGETTFGDTSSPTPGAAYMTVAVRAVSFYQNSNFWTSFVETNRQAVITASLNGIIAGTQVSQTQTGQPVDLRRNRSIVDLGYAGILVDHLPTTFSGMTMSVQVNKTAKDGLQGLISQVAQLSATTPPTLSISQQAMGITSLSKNIADFLFHAQLLVQGITSKNPLPANGLLAPGIYVSLAGDSESDYSQYLAPGNPGLSWSGTQLTYNGMLVQRISYFVIEVAYQKRLFAQPTDALSLGGIKSWAALFQLGKREINTFNTEAEAEKTVNDVQSHLSDARTLLDADPDYIQGEKDDIYGAVYADVNSAYQKRLMDLHILVQPAAASQPTATSSAQAPIRPAMMPQPALVQAHQAMLDEIHGARPVLLAPLMK
jgi:hypothetical protein